MGGVPGVVVSGASTVSIVTLLVTRRADSVAPEMLPVVPPTVKSCGSMCQVPVSPRGAAVVILATSAILTVWAEVSIAPPLPPWGALASSVPLMFVVPFCMSPSSRIVPLRFSRVRASTTPVLLTAARRNWLADCAVISTWPPSAWIRPPFCARALIAP
ncbi:MAG: hypothetical protein WDM86_03455 [Rhizomicrobium sp.]